MATMLRFDNAVIGITTVGTDEFVSGSGRLTLAGYDVAVTTADARIHNIRHTITPSATCEIYGDMTALNNAVGFGVTVQLLRGETQIYGDFTGVITAVYNTQRFTTTITIAGEPVTTLPVVS